MSNFRGCFVALILCASSPSFGQGYFPAGDTTLYPTGPIQFHWPSEVTGPIIMKGSAFQLTLNPGTGREEVLPSTTDTFCSYQGWKRGASYTWKVDYYQVPHGGAPLGSVCCFSFQIAASSSVALPEATTGAFSVSENPFTKQTELQFDVSKMAYVGVEVFDVMGRAIFGDDGGKIYDLGRQTMPIDLTTAPSGMYYLRISLGTGEVQTIKLMKE